MNPRASNPMLPRMEHIATQYGPYVTMSTFGAWAEATGQHGLREHAARIFHDSAGGDALTSVMRVLPRIARDWHAPLNTRFDRYLPWAAREFNRIYKPYKKFAKRHGLPAVPPRYDLVARTFTLATDESIPALEAVQSGMATLVSDTRYLQNSFRAIVDWAEDEHVDLNAFAWPEAAEAASVWAEERQLDALPQGVVVYRFDDGWTVQQLDRQDQLDGESEYMQNCLDNYVAGDPVTGYDGQQQVWIFSLRDPTGAPHATMEWDLADSYVSQLRGKQNDIPKREYLERMAGFREGYLDPIVRELGFIDTEPPKGNDFFGKTPLLGAYKNGVETVGKPDSILLLYDLQNRSSSDPNPGGLFTLGAIQEAYGKLIEQFDRSWENIEYPRDLDEKEREAWEQEVQEEVWAEVSSNASVWILAEESDADFPLHWIAWRDHQVVLDDNEDEMVNWFAGGRWSPVCRFLGQRVANKADLLAIPRAWYRGNHGGLPTRRRRGRRHLLHAARSRRRNPRGRLHPR